MDKNKTHLYATYKTVTCRLSVRPETIKLLEETEGVHFLTLVLAIFSESVSSSEGNKSKNKQMGTHKTKKLLHSEGNHKQNRKATY